MNECSKCHKKLGIFSIKHKTLDGAIVCRDCIKEWARQENLKKGLITQEGDKAIYQKAVTAKRGESIRKTPIACPACNKNFETDINFAITEQVKENEEVNIDTICPQCGMKLKGTIKKTGVESWSCEYCGQQFPTKEETEEHEKNCNLKPR